MKVISLTMLRCLITDFCEIFFLYPLFCCPFWQGQILYMQYWKWKQFRFRTRTCSFMYSYITFLYILDLCWPWRSWCKYNKISHLPLVTMVDWIKSYWQDILCCIMKRGQYGRQNLKSLSQREAEQNHWKC